ncbi:hypothetical protein T05_12982, partial [Trichinella murrelli]
LRVSDRISSQFYNDEVIRPWQPFHNSGLQQLLDRSQR